jgi:hypothetical protein
MAAIFNFLSPHLTFLLLFPFYNPTINLHVLTVLPIGGIINRMLLPVPNKLQILKKGVYSYQ